MGSVKARQTAAADVLARIVETGRISTLRLLPTWFELIAQAEGCGIDLRQRVEQSPGGPRYFAVGLPRPSASIVRRTTSGGDR
jgi:hypothetical protein